jgi:hypothetical protein
VKNRNTHWLVRIILCIMFLLTVFSFVPNIAHAKAAITCYKDGCDDTDPVVTGCGTSPSTVTTLMRVSLSDGDGFLEIRLSHARPYGCNTIWARITAYPKLLGNQVSAYIYSYRTTDSETVAINADQYTSGWSNQFGRDGEFYGEICDYNQCASTSPFS